MQRDVWPLVSSFAELQMFVGPVQKHKRQFVKCCRIRRVSGTEQEHSLSKAKLNVMSIVPKRWGTHNLYAGLFMYPEIILIVLYQSDSVLQKSFESDCNLF